MAVPRTTSEEPEGEETIVGPAIAIRGRIEGQEDLRVEGRVEGSISLTETLYVEPQGVVLAEVDARDVVISGIVIGNITALDSVTLNKAAKLVGNIAAPRVIIADGASFSGDVIMEGEDFQNTPSRTRATSTAPRTTSGGRTATRSRGAVSGSYDSSRAPARRDVVTPPERAPARRAAPPAPPARRSSAEEDDVTVVIKHSALRKGEAPPEDDDSEKTTRRRRAKKSARTPARGRSKAGRRKT